MLRPLLPLVVVALSVLLSACFVAETPKFTTSSAVAALGTGGRYSVFERREDGEYRWRESVTLKQMPDGSYQLIQERSLLPFTPVSFHEIGNGRIVGQKSLSSKGGPYVYFILSKTDKDMLLHVPLCVDQARGFRSKYRLTPFGQQHQLCSIDSVTDPAKLFTSVNIGEPMGKIVPE